MSFLLPTLIFLPLLAAGLLLLLRPGEGPLPRWTALLATVATLLLSMAIASQYNILRKGSRDAEAAAQSQGAVMPLVEVRHEWMTFTRPDGSGARLEFYIGLDGISLLLVLLTTLLSACCVLGSWD